MKTGDTVNFLMDTVPFYEKKWYYKMVCFLEFRNGVGEVHNVRIYRLCT